MVQLQVRSREERNSFVWKFVQKAAVVKVVIIDMHTKKLLYKLYYNVGDEMMMRMTMMAMMMMLQQLATFILHFHTSST